METSTINFLKKLAKNNNKPWFDEHRKEYETAKKDFETFIQSVIDKLGKEDKMISGQKAKDCMFRINRDIRFSKDKSPYKANFGASISKGGRKSTAHAGYYFHLEPGKSFTGGGLYMPLPDGLKKVRQEIDYNLEDFKKILTAKKFKSVYGDLDRSKELVLTRVPAGYEPGDPAADFLKLKSFISMTPLTDADVTSKDLVKKTVAALLALRPLNDFLNQAIEN